jgi:hypothetical protein
MEGANLRTYTVMQLLSSGSRFTDDYDAEGAIEHFMHLHPEADKATVRAELIAEMRRLGCAEDDLPRTS